MKSVTHVLVAIIAFATLATALYIRAAAPAVQKQNAADAIALNKKFETLTLDSPCQPNDTACINGGFAKCAAVSQNGKIVNKFQPQPCNTDLKCFALPLVNSPGTSLVCTTEADKDARIKNAQDAK